MNDTAPKPAEVLRWQTGAPNASPVSTNKRAIWDLAIGVAGLIYLDAVLFGSVYSPAFGLVLAVLAAYEVLEPRCGKRGG
ncbi:MAG TPA: hypothetical protein VE959_01705 [Bryobacteraceae bacterium]|nr:hypothetical protein [Bryobacteraceae bacterium]